jgi:hypothetical protein
MTAEEKLEKASREFCSLSEEKQDYILGILQALTFAKDEIKTFIEPSKNVQKGAYDEQ